MERYFIHIAAEAGLESADVIDHLVNGVFVVGVDTRFHYINKPVLKKFMMTGDELRSRSFLDFVHPEDREYARAVFQSLLAGENISPFIIRYDINGQCGTTEIRARSLLGAKGLAGVIATAHDVREKQATDFDCISFIELLPIPMGIFSIDGIVEYINPAFVNLFGYSLEDVRTFDEWFSKAYPDERIRAQLRNEWEADLATMQPGPMAQKTLAVACKDGSTKQAVFSVMMYEPQKILFIAQESREAPSNKIVFEEGVLQMQRMETFAVLAGMIAHDLNNVLSGIVGNLSLLKRICNASAEAGEILHDLNAFTNQGSALVKNLLSLAQGSDLEKKVFDLNECVREAASIFGRLHGEIRIFYDLFEERCPICASHPQMEQVLLNLFINAHHAMPDGGALYLSTAIVNIDDKTAARANVVPGTYAMLSVRDTGCGMDAQTVKKIFDPFFSTKPRGAGSGLGLTSAREIIQKHGGAISVESTPNIGTLFVIFLPLADE